MARAGIRGRAWPVVLSLLMTPTLVRAQSAAGEAGAAQGAAGEAGAAPGAATSAATQGAATGTPASTSAGTNAAPAISEIPTTPREQPPVYAPNDGFTTPRPGPQTSTGGQDPARRWRVRQAPLAGAEASWGAPGNQMPEFAEVGEPLQPTAKGPPPRGMGRIVSGAILGPAGLGLTIAGIVGATTPMLGEHKRLSVPMIGVGLVSSALGWALFADGILRRKAFMRWQSKQGGVALVPALAPGRFAGLSLVGRF